MALHETDNSKLELPFQTARAPATSGFLVAFAAVVLAPLPAYACGNAMQLQPLDVIFVSIFGMLVGSLLAIPALLWALSTSRLTWSATAVIALSASVCTVAAFHLGLYVSGGYVGAYRPEILQSAMSAIRDLSPGQRDLRDLILLVTLLGLPIATSFGVAVRSVRGDHTAASRRKR
ncbi:MAG: hypothetical protein ACLFVJ_18225 [Persicimonas sp.]